MNDVSFKDELAKIADQIDNLIANDNFTKNITPAFLRNAVLDYPLRHGKKLRPALLIWTCGLFGGKEENALSPAAAVEIFHNWTLVHDDIIDNDKLRKGKPSTHISLANFAKKKFKVNPCIAECCGKNFAILTGDIQHAWAIHTLLKTPVPPNVLTDLTKDLCNLAGRDLICGETLDVEISYKKWSNTNLSKLIKIAELKTARLLQFCTICGAKIALQDSAYTPENQHKISTIANFAKFAGIAFQFKDDWLGIYANEKTIGKPVMSDLAENKPTTLLLEAFRRASKKERSTLKSLAGQKEYTEKEISTIRKIISDTGAEKFCLKKSEEFQRKALMCLKHFPESKFKNLLEQWTIFLINRTK